MQGKGASFLHLYPREKKAFVSLYILWKSSEQDIDTLLCIKGFSFNYQNRQHSALSQANVVLFLIQEPSDHSMELVKLFYLCKQNGAG